MATADEWALFLNVDGSRFNPDGLGSLVRELIRASGVRPRKGACHLFRHTMATVLLEGGADVRYVQEMLGHAKLETTQIYTRVSIAKLKEIHTAAHPARMERTSTAVAELLGESDDENDEDDDQVDEDQELDDELDDELDEDEEDDSRTSRMPSSRTPPAVTDGRGSRPPGLRPVLPASASRGAEPRSEADCATVGALAAA